MHEVKVKAFYEKDFLKCDSFQKQKMQIYNTHSKYAIASVICHYALCRWLPVVNCNPTILKEREK